MSIILVRPRNVNIPTDVVSTQYPINIGYLSSWLKKNGINVKILDLEVDDISEETFIRFVRKNNPALVGFSCMSSNILAGHRLAKIIKEALPDLKIAVGGPHSTAIPKRTLEEFTFFDIVVKGEGEITTVELYNALIKKADLKEVEGLVYRNFKGDIVETSDRPLIDNLNILPFPDRDALPINLYERTHTSRAFSRLNKNIAEIMTARGCPFNCIFCASKVTFGRMVRYRSVENIIREMEECIGKYQTQHFSILDDTFTFRKDILYPVCEYLKEKKVTWDCFTRVDRINEEMVKKLVDSGCEKISFGIESGSEKILKLIGKDISISQIKEAARICRKAGLRYLEATFMLGNHPLETKDDIQATLDLIKIVNPDLMGFSLTAPFPGTELNRVMKEGGYLVKEDWNEFVLYGGTPSWKFKFTNVDELKKIQKKFTKQFYLRPGYIIRQISKIKDIREFIYWGRTAIAMLKSF